MNTPTPDQPTPGNIVELCPRPPLKKESVRPADPAIIEPTNTPNEIMLHPHEDGIMFRCSPKHPEAVKGAWVVHDGLKTVVAIAVNKDIAALLCAATHLYLESAKKAAAAAAAAAPAATPEASK